MVRRRRTQTPGGPFQLIGPGNDPSTCIAVNGSLYDIGVPVVKWFDAGGFDGYTTERVVNMVPNSRADRYEKRVVTGWRYGRRDTNAIRQIVIHHTGGDGDGAGRVFNTLFNERKLSVHFVVDDDGRVFQFLDVKEKAWHAGKCNETSVGIECNLFPLYDRDPDYYSDKSNKRSGNLPHSVGAYTVHGRTLQSFEMPALQVDSTARLAAGVWAAMHRETRMPRFTSAPMFPHDEMRGQIVRTAIPGAREHVGLLGHMNITKRKIDPLGLDLDEFEQGVGRMYNLAADDAACEQRS